MEGRGKGGGEERLKSGGGKERLEIKARVSVWKGREKGGEERLQFERDVGRITSFKDKGKGIEITGCSLEGKEEGRRRGGRRGWK